MLKLSGNGNECKPLDPGTHFGILGGLLYDRCGPQVTLLVGRGLHSSTPQLNLSTFYGIGGARRGCVARVKGVLRGSKVVQGVFVRQTRLKLS